MSIYKDLIPTEFEELETYSLKSRPSKVTTREFSRPISKEDSIGEFLGKLPDILAVQSIRDLTKRMIQARSEGKPIIWGIGGHVVKTGLSPIVIDLMKSGFVSAIATNGSVLIHDFEIASVGFTSEDVDATLGKGDFGAAKETGEALNRAAGAGARDGIGLGEAMCRETARNDPEFAKFSLLVQCYRKQIPVTSHITIGADIGHFHPSAKGESLGAASHHDFKLFCSLVGKMDNGGVYLNWGSAVTLPEVFLKAVTINRNLGRELRNITTANFDFIQHYRPTVNVIRRPNAGGAGKGFAITGHHEIMLPLLAAHLMVSAE